MPLSIDRGAALPAACHMHRARALICGRLVWDPLSRQNLRQMSQRAQRLADAMLDQQRMYQRERQAELEQQVILRNFEQEFLEVPRKQAQQPTKSLTRAFVK